MIKRSFLLFLLLSCVQSDLAATAYARYYGHVTVEDDQGVIAPWYNGLNGQCDYRIRIAAETLKRYPWTTTNNAVAAYPHYIFSGAWRINTNGDINPITPNDWDNGDLGQRATSLFNGMTDYYRYTGDPAAIAQLTYMADFLLDHSVTPPGHPWPGLFVSVPTKGKSYGDANPQGYIQLDICASAGRGLLRAYQLTGNKRWLEGAKHWADVMVEHCNPSPGAEPWPRYANPEDVKWGKQKDGNLQTGGVTLMLAFLDELIRLGETGNGDAFLKARVAGKRYLSETLLPAWIASPTWGCYFWDWPNAVQNCLTTPDAACYLIEHPTDFPNWRNDARNVLTLFLNRTSVNPGSGVDVYSGGWAYAESSSCCGRSLWYAPLNVAPTIAEWAAMTGDDWARELAYRQIVLQTYDIHESGVTEDNIDGGVIVNGAWFNIAHPLPLRFLMTALQWMPEELGASRENHIVRSSAVVNFVKYGSGEIIYSTFDAPAQTVDVLRLAYVPKIVKANGESLRKRSDLQANGYTVRELPNGDAIVTIRHDDCQEVSVSGKDPQKMAEDDTLKFDGGWRNESDNLASGKSLHLSRVKGASVIIPFFGNQVRLIGRADLNGGLADIYLDDKKQLVPIDCWNPKRRDQQVLYYKNGLADGAHILRLVARGEHNPYSTGDSIYVDGAQSSDATGKYNFPANTGPTNAQRMIFGYSGREDYIDSRGQRWKPATEFVTRIASGRDSIPACWWIVACSNNVAGNPDPELYRYGVHAPEFWANLTVGPGKYHAILKLAATHDLEKRTNYFTIFINGRRMIEKLNVASAAGGPNRTLDLAFDNLAPLHGIIEVRLKAPPPTSTNTAAYAEAFLQALEIGPGPAGKSSTHETALMRPN
jgi:hypothetical protein